MSELYLKVCSLGVQKCFIYGFFGPEKYATKHVLPKLLVRPTKCEFCLYNDEYIYV